MAHTSFDYAGLKRAFETPDIPALIEFYAEDAEWIEYKPGAPFSSPRRMVGKATIQKFVQGVADYGVKLTMSDEVIGDERIAFCMIFVAPDGETGIEHVICHHRDGKIIRQVDVEAK
jgi:ketosteroid isomerase-like protein